MDNSLDTLLDALPQASRFTIPPLPDEKVMWIENWEWEERCAKWEVVDDSWPEWDTIVTNL